MPRLDPTRVPSFVAGAASRLRAAGDQTALDVALDQLARDLVPDCADTCAIELFDGERLRSRVAALADAAASELARVRARFEKFPFELDADGGIPDEGRQARIRLPADSDSPLARDLGWSCWIVAPIPGASRPLGALTMAVRTGVLDDDDLELARCLAELVALAVGGARLDDDREQLLSVMSHDLRNPLGVVMLVVDYLRGATLPPALANQLGRLERAASTMDRVLNDLVDAGRLGSAGVPLDLQAVDGDALLREACDDAQPAAEQKGVTIDRATAGVEVPADRARLLRALELLVAGAVQRSPAGQRVSVSLERIGDCALWRVEDGAPAGAADGNARRRIGAFAWMVVSRVVGAHGGSVWLDTAPGGGTVVSVSIPLVPALGRGPASSSSRG